MGTLTNAPKTTRSEIRYEIEKHAGNLIGGLVTFPVSQTFSTPLTVYWNDFDNPATLAGVTTGGFARRCPRFFGSWAERESVWRQYTPECDEPADSHYAFARKSACT